MSTLRLRLCAAFLAPLLAGACSTLHIDPFPDPIRAPKEASAAAAQEQEALPPAEAPPVQTRIARAPGVVIQRTVAEGIADRLGQDLTGDPIRVSFHDVPLVPFINEVFGEELGMSFVISPGLREKIDLVTLKLTEPLPPSQLFATARRVLGEYGIDVREVEQGILNFAPSQEVASRDVPLLVSGRTLPEVPATHRIIFQLVPLHVVRGPQVRGWLKEAFDSKELKIFEDPDRSALLLKGDADTLARALAMIEVLDQPLLRGRHGVIVEPVFMPAGELARAFESVLRAEGYQASVGATRAILNLFYKNNRVVIRSRPRLLVKSGETASIDVGNEIPVITQTSADETQVGGSTNVLQEVSYRKTGGQLEIKPLVQANGLVDLQISQQLSEASTTAATNLPGSPTILNRRISTSLTLKDGGSLLMGGLISGNQSAGETGVPFLGQVPVLGRLFRSDAVQEDRTELLVMVTPYVVADHEEGWELTRRVREQLGLYTELSP